MFISICTCKPSLFRIYFLYYLTAICALFIIIIYHSQHASDLFRTWFDICLFVWIWLCNAEWCSHISPAFMGLISFVWYFTFVGIHFIKHSIKKIYGTGWNVADTLFLHMPKFFSYMIFWMLWVCHCLRIHHLQFRLWPHMPPPPIFLYHKQHFTTTWWYCIKQNGTHVRFHHISFHTKVHSIQFCFLSYNGEYLYFSNCR